VEVFTLSQEVLMPLIAPQRKHERQALTIKVDVRLLVVVKA